MKLYSRVRLLLEGVIGNGYYRKIVRVSLVCFHFKVEKQMQERRGVLKGGFTIVFVNISQQEMYEKLFSGAVSEYNAKQKRNDRKITVSYYEHQFGRGYFPNVVTSADKRKSFYEDVVQIGDMKDTGVGTVDAETAKTVLTEYMNDFEQRNPNFKVFCAVLHMDEATPHLHIDYVPIGHYSRGIPVQNGIAQALHTLNDVL